MKFKPMLEGVVLKNLQQQKFNMKFKPLSALNALPSTTVEI